MNVTEAKFKDRQLQRKGHLQKVSAEQKEYAEASACRRIAESTDIITDLQTAGLLEKILHRDNLNKAYKKVKSNKGSGGVDGMCVEELLTYLREHGGELNQQILKGKQAITQVLTPIFEKQFSENSFGFRPKRSAHDALKQCQRNANEGYVYVVDMDLEKFFDNVCQSKLIEVLSRTIKV